MIPPATPLMLRASVYARQTHNLLLLGPGERRRAILHYASPWNQSLYYIIVYICR